MQNCGQRKYPSLEGFYGKQVTKKINKHNCGSMQLISSWAIITPIHNPRTP